MNPSPNARILRATALFAAALLLLIGISARAAGVSDTGQDTCYSDTSAITCPEPGQPFFGQDAQYRGTAPSYEDNGDGTVSDTVTGLLWQKAHNPRATYSQAAAACDALDLGGHSDWRLPSIKELFSLTDFRGKTGGTFFLDNDYFDLEIPYDMDFSDDAFKSTHSPEMMGQTWSSTIYTGNHWGRGIEAAFFMNFLDGHLKNAPTADRAKGLFYRCVRGDEYGMNEFTDNRDGTVTDAATGLTWQQADDGTARDWQHALAYCEDLSLAGNTDWRLPNVKELQSLVDYSRNDPALDLDYFTQKDRLGWFWSSTTHGDSPRMGIYVCFGKCVSVDGVDTHGAGAQRSDPKSQAVSGPAALGGQQDAVRVMNYARCVRGGASYVQPTGPGSDAGARMGGPGAGGPGQGGAGAPAPPQFAIDACRNASEGDACTINAPHGKVSGTCTTGPSQALFCKPRGGPQR